MCIQRRIPAAGAQRMNKREEGNLLKQADRVARTVPREG